MVTIVAPPVESHTILNLLEESETTPDPSVQLAGEDGQSTPPPTSEVTRTTSAGGYRFARRAELEALGLLLGILIVLLVASATIGSPPG